MTYCVQLSSKSSNSRKPTLRYVEQFEALSYRNWPEAPPYAGQSKSPLICIIGHSSHCLMLSGMTLCIRASVASPEPSIYQLSCDAPLTRMHTYASKIRASGRPWSRRSSKNSQGTRATQVYCQKGQIHPKKVRQKHARTWWHDSPWRSSGRIHCLESRPDQRRVVDATKSPSRRPNSHLHCSVALVQVRPAGHHTDSLARILHWPDRESDMPLGRSVPNLLRR